MNRREALAIAAGASIAAALPRVTNAATLEGALQAIADADFIAIGERHDNPMHHQIQADLVRALAPDGLAFEMVPRAMEDEVNALRRAGVSRAKLGDALAWEERGWPNWSQYAPIFEAVPDAYIAGGGLAKSTLGDLYARGASGADPALVTAYGLAEPLPDEERAAMLDEQFDAHCEMIDRDQLGSMVEIQRVWDAAYADALWRAGGRGGGRAVLICGNAHARLDRGAPATLLRAFPDARVASVGLLETGDVEPDRQFTITISALAPDRDDPCDRMREAMEKG